MFILLLQNINTPFAREPACTRYVVSVHGDLHPINTTVFACTRPLRIGGVRGEGTANCNLCACIVQRADKRCVQTTTKTRNATVSKVRLQLPPLPPLLSVAGKNADYFLLLPISAGCLLLLRFFFLVKTVLRRPTRIIVYIRPLAVHSQRPSFKVKAEILSSRGRPDRYRTHNCMRTVYTILVHARARRVGNNSTFRNRASVIVLSNTGVCYRNTLFVCFFQRPLFFRSFALDVRAPNSRIDRRLISVRTTRDPYPHTRHNCRC